MNDYFYDYDDSYFMEHDSSSDAEYSDQAEYTGPDELNLEELWSTCIQPSVAQVFVYVGSMIAWNVIFRVTTQLANLPLFVQHLSSAFCGLLILYTTVGFGTVYVLGFITSTYLIYLILYGLRVRKLGYGISVFCIAILAISEIFGSDAKLLHQIRGVQMIAAMKLISLAFDLDASIVAKPPTAMQFFGYTMCPANCTLGPWSSYTDYAQLFSKTKFTFRYLIAIVGNALLAVLFLVFSNCIISSVISSNSSKWIVAYRDALSFRTSHYFISFLSQATMVTAGYKPVVQSTTTTTTTTNPHPKCASPLQQTVTRPLQIEFCRSIVQVVIAWNIPMHNWLKTYVFRVLMPYGTFVAILMTYTVSALLHGLNFQLGAVLLSLGVYTYVEFRLRQKLAHIFSACILANPCKRCTHKYRGRNAWVVAVNVAFGFVAMMHLTYLGVMFASSSTLQEEGFSYTHAIGKWKSLDFLSHWIIGGFYVFYLMI